MTNWIEISAARLAANYRVLVQAAGQGTDVLAVVKADAYGHGADLCAVELARAGERWFGVASAKEGTWLRLALEKAGFSGESAPRILVMCGFLRPSAAVMAERSLTPVVWTVEQVEWLAGTGVRVHVEIETGMGRQGVRPGADLAALLDAIDVAGLALDGVMTHFCAAEVADGELTRMQQKRFAEAVEQVRERGARLAWVHAGSSSSLDNLVGDRGWLERLAQSSGARAMVRCGIALYGYCLPIAGGGEANIRSQLRTVMTWKTRVIDVRDTAAGKTFGYNGTFTAQHAMRVALLPVGYADGLRRELSSTNERAGGWVMVRGRDGIARPAAILGRVSMNLTTVDVSAINDLRVGDEVVLLGDGITADDHARLANTISYEILCGVRVG